MSNDVGTIGAKRISTGRLYFKPTGSAYELDLGNVVKWKRNDKTETVDHMASKNGVRIVDATTVHTLGFGYLFTLDEYSDQVVAALQKAGVSVPIAATTVNAVSSGTASVASAVIGATYSVGAINLATLTVSVGGTAKVSGVDYLADLGAGRFTVLQGGGISAADALSVTYTAPQYKKKVVTSATLPTLLGTFAFYETDQISSIVRAEHTFSGSAWINGDSEEQTTGFRTVDLNVTATSAPVINERV